VVEEQGTGSEEHGTVSDEQGTVGRMQRTAGERPGADTQRGDGGAVAILGGTGPLGRGLAARLALAGRTVHLGSRAADRAEESVAGLLDRLDGDVDLRPATNEDAVAAATIVVIAVPYEGQEPTLRSLGDPATLVVNAVNPLGMDDRGPHVLDVAAGSASEEAQELWPGSTVVAAFKSVPARRLLDLDHTADCDTFVAGDDDAAVDRVAALVGEIEGMRGVPCGPLRMSRYLETLTPIMIGVNRRHRSHAALRVVGI
jgi:8-hydroxy-5-deazaflavin:NADPH oxidoreductase